MVTLTKRHVYKNGGASYAQDGVRASVYVGPKMFSGAAPESISFDAPNLATPDADAAGKEQAKAEKAAAREAKKTEREQARAAKAQERETAKAQRAADKERKAQERAAAKAAKAASVNQPSA